MHSVSTASDTSDSIFFQLLILFSDGRSEVFSDPAPFLELDLKDDRPIDTILIECRNKNRFRRVNLDLTSNPKSYRQWLSSRNRVLVEGVDASWVKSVVAVFADMTKKMEKRDRWASFTEAGASSASYALFFWPIYGWLFLERGLSTLQIIFLVLFFVIFLPCFILFQCWKIERVREHFPIVEFRFGTQKLSAVEGCVKYVL